MKALAKIFKIKLRKGDMVVVIRGRLKGRSGRVTAIHPRTNKVTVGELDVVKRHVKPSRENPQGGIIEVNRPLFVSKVALVEPKSGKPTRVGCRISADGKRERIYKRSGQPVRPPAKNVEKAGK